MTLTQPEETKQSLEAKLFRDLLGGDHQCKRPPPGSTM